MKTLADIRKNAKISDLWYFGILGAILVTSLGFASYSQCNYRELLVGAVVIVGLLGLLGIKMWTSVSIHRFAVIFILVIGTLSLVIQPILNVPDETTHLARAEMVSRGGLVVDKSVTEYDIIHSVQDLQQNAKKTYFASSLKGEGIDYTMTKTGHVAASNATIMYIPQAAGIIIAKVLQLDAIWMLWLARFMNLVMYAFGIGLALKIAPKAKMALFFVATLPMCMQQAGSCSPDAFVNLVGVLLVAYFIRLYCEEEGNITWKKLLLFMGLAAFVAISKITNIFMAGLVFLIPKNKFKNEKQSFLIKMALVLGVIFCGAAYYLYTTTFPSGQEHMAYLEGSNVSSGGQINYILTNFVEWVRHFGTSLIYNSESYMMSLSTFGWLEYRNGIIPIVSMILFGRLCSRDQGINTKRIQKSLIFLMMLAIYAGTCFAMYIAWTPVGSSGIAGIQGRYFIPMIALSTLLFVPTNETEERKATPGDWIAILSISGIMLIDTLAKYY